MDWSQARYRGIRTPLAEDSGSGSTLRALQPEFLVLDEPVSALDVSVGAQVINLLRTLQRTRGLTCLFISHSMPLVRYVCDRIAVMQGGRIVECGDAVSLCREPREAYTRQLVGATPELIV